MSKLFAAVFAALTLGGFIKAAVCDAPQNIWWPNAMEAAICLKTSRLRAGSVIRDDIIESLLSHRVNTVEWSSDLFREETGTLSRLLRIVVKWQFLHDRLASHTNKSRNACGCRKSLK